MCSLLCVPQHLACTPFGYRQSVCSVVSICPTLPPLACTHPFTGKKKKKSPGKSKGKDGGGGDGLFSGDGRDNKAAGGGSSGEKSDKKGRYLRDRSGLDKTTLNKIKRGGAGKRSFKSKAKFKRRKK
jgi:hypothetical protein